MNGCVESKCIALQRAAMDFKHMDRKVRYEKVMAVLGQSDCSLSFPYLFKDQHQLKGFYRFINNTAVTHELLMAGYHAGLIQYEKEREGKQPWLLIQDTMMTDFNSRSLDLGYTQTDRSNGFLLHHGLLLDESATPLGLLHQKVIHRERSDFGKAKQWRSKPTGAKESNKWIQGVQTGVAFSKATARALIHIMDREADIIDLINTCNQSKGQYFIIRARHDRSTLTNGQRQQQETLERFRLFQLMPSLPGPTIIERKLRGSKGKEYKASCYLNYHCFAFRGIQQPLFCVWVKETEARQGQEQAEWFLLTNLQITSIKEAEQVAEWYSKRWIVEEYHKCYKTGCSIEKRQFNSRKALSTAIGLLALSAIVLLRSSYYARQQQEAPFETVVQDKVEQALAKAVANQYLKPVDTTSCKPFTTLWWLLLLGRMGGHQGIKQKGLPGWQTLWKGYAHFQSLLKGFRLTSNTS